MSSERREYFARGLSGWLRESVGLDTRPDPSLWIDMQVAAGHMTEREAHEFERWLEARVG